ncbi:transglycosylase domain-containing protein [Anaeroselena agilis]|uniref:Transglycosylase domain-containing protein n=1 Tax=Anaeroselena agilis TaxID=3063788 RepID=A0ABU3P0T6_9FIRM|nr:transglycosylase domain-containing protein [Selenomonadales bacterium 4137-cl]
MRGKFLLFLLIVFVAAFVWAGGGKLAPQFAPPKLPEVKADADSAWMRAYRVFALKKAVAATVDRKNYIPLKDIPLTLQQAVIAVEDHRFYRHIGLDIEGILRAALVNLQHGAIAEGGSTITQQLVKNLFLTSEQTWGRKLEEVVLALDMELRYSKEEILELYLNSIYFGSGANGIGQASKIYFAKKPAALTLAESALLAGLPNAPSLYSPYVDPAAARQRQAVVLNAMAKYNYIGPTTAQEARQAPLRLAK